MRREHGMDCIKTIAVILVFVIHFIGYGSLYSNYEFKTLYNIQRYALYSIALTCVPLFFLCTGYLSHVYSMKKALLSALSTYSIYLFYALIFLIVGYFYKGQPFCSTHDIFNQMIMMCGITGREWYIRSYLVIVLLAPVLNSGWKGLSKNNKKYLVVLLFFATTILKTISLIFNITIYPADFFADNAAIWPLLYFFIGKYIAEYKVSFSKKWIVLGVTVIFSFETIFLCFKFAENIYGDYLINYHRIDTFLLSLLLFLLFYDIQFDEKIGRFFKLFSNASLDAYLGAVIIEDILYTYALSWPEFWKTNFWKLPIDILIWIIIGNIRKMISDRINRKIKSSKIVYLEKVILCGILFSLILFLTKYTVGKYSFWSYNAGKSGQIALCNASCEDGHIISNMNAVGFITYGPYIELPSGKYNVTINYETDSDNYYVDAAINSGNLVLTEYPLTKEDKKRSFIIDVKEEKTPLEIRTFCNNEGGRLKIYSIIVTQKE